MPSYSILAMRDFLKACQGINTQLQLMIPSWLREKSGDCGQLQISSHSIIAHFGGIGIFCTHY
jgi:hypothetical protein